MAGGTGSQSEEGKEREVTYKAARQAKRYRVGRQIVVGVPRCKKCAELHKVCPGPEVNEKGEWEFSIKCLRCNDMTLEVECDFQGEKISVYVSVLFHGFSFISCYTTRTSEY